MGTLPGDEAATKLSARKISRGVPAPPAVSPLQGASRSTMPFLDPNSDRTAAGEAGAVGRSVSSARDDSFPGSSVIVEVGAAVPRSSALRL